VYREAQSAVRASVGSTRGEILPGAEPYASRGGRKQGLNPRLGKVRSAAEMKKRRECFELSGEFPGARAKAARSLAEALDSTKARRKGRFWGRQLVGKRGRSLPSKYVENWAAPPEN